MNWYKLAQSQSQSLSQSQSQPLVDDYSSALVKTEKLVKELGLDEILSEFAIKRDYQSAIDYVVCSLYPQYESGCRAYYNGTGKKLNEILDKNEIKKLDDICGKDVLFFYYKLNKVEKKNELV